MSDVEARLIYSTCPDAQTARVIGRKLVEAELAACVNILPGMTAIYRWEGAVEEDAEVVLLIKTRAELVDRVIALGCALHPYETPAFVAFKIEAGSSAYLAWLAEQTGA